MSNAEYIRQAAAKNSWKKYYATMRPVSIGTQPKMGMMDYINYDSRTDVGGHMAWAEIYYNRELTAAEMSAYELIEG